MSLHIARHPPITRVHVVSWLQVFDGLAGSLCVGNLTPGTLANIAANVDDKDFICQVNFPQVHIVEHLLHAGLPDIVVARMSEQANTDNNAALQRQAFLRFHEMLFETGTSAERYYFVLLTHIVQSLKSQNPVPVSGSNFRPIEPPTVGRSSISAV